jgi:hypothetical protein
VQNIANLTDKQIEEVCELIKKGVKYREILKRFKKISTVSQITKIKHRYIEKQQPKRRKHSERTKRRLSKKAQRREIAKKSKIIIDHYVNVLKGFEYSITNIEEIQQLHADKLPEVLKGINTLNETVKKIYHVTPEQAEETLAEIKKAAGKVNNLFYHSNMRLRAIAELRRQLESFVKLKIDVEVLNEIGKIIQAFFKGLQVLKDADYFRVKNEVISHNEATAGWFDRYEGLDGGTEPGEIEEAKFTEEPVTGNSDGQKQ